ncbi:MAG: hypothetical protein JSS78_10530 [Bacteroidetes bacterium]|nr:hypothetical protein [Bacteroidota bacterium]
MFQIELPDPNTDIEGLVSAQRACIANLLSEGKLLAYSVASNLHTIWCVVLAHNEKEAMDIVASFPLQKHFVDVSFQKLLIHNTTPTALPEIFLN